jgi:hypothetical protein
MNEKEFSDSICEEQIRLAERELSAFVGAVTELFGPEQAKRAAEDWLDESQLLHGRSRSTPRDWRAITVAASARLAKQLNLA